MLSLPLYIFEKYVFLCNFVRFIIPLCYFFLNISFMHWDFQVWGINKYLHTYHVTADVCLALILQVTDDLQNF